MLTNNEVLARFAMRFRSHNMIKDMDQMLGNDDSGAPWYYEMHELGYNYRLSDINCALALNQLDRLETNNQRRNELALAYQDYLENVDHLDLPYIPNRQEGRHSWHLYAPRFNFKALGKTRQQVMKELAGHGVGTQVHYIPLYKQPYHAGAFAKNWFSGAERHYAQTLSLPMYFGLKRVDIEQISNILKAILH